MTAEGDSFAVICRHLPSLLYAPLYGGRVPDGSGDVRSKQQDVTAGSQCQASLLQWQNLFPEMFNQ